MSIKSGLLGIALLALSPFFVYGQLLDPVDYEITDMPQTVQAGEIFNVTVEASIKGEWHLYSILNDPDAGPYPTTFSSGNSQLAIADDPVESEADVQYDPNFDTELGWHSKAATFTIPVAFKPEVSGAQNVLLEVLYQVCDDKSCLPPKTKQIEADIEVAGVSASPFTDFPEESESGVEISQTDGGEEYTFTSESGVASDSIWGFIWIAITAGFAALLTPCVFPLIPLVVSYFSNQQGGESKKTSWGQAIIFGLSIVLIFTLIGALLALILGVAGVSQFASNPFVNLFIGILFIIFGVSLLGMFELRLPYQLTNWLNKKSNEGTGLVGTLFMGSTISAVSFSCTAPFVGAILAATTGGEWFFPIVGMLAFSTAFASPFVLFAMFPGYLESLPKSGSWMNVIKVVLGFIILAASVKFFANADIVWGWDIITRPLGIAFWISLFLLSGFYLIGLFGMHGDDRPKSITAGRLLTAIPFILFSFYLIPGLLGASLGIWDAWLPAKKANDVSVVNSIGISGGQNTDTTEWLQDFEEAKQVAIENDQPLFVDFTGYTCTNCRAMESTVFPKQNIVERFDQLLKVKLYTDGGADADKNQTLQFGMTGTLALPTYVIMDPESEQILDQLIGYTRAENFQLFLDNGISRYRSKK